MDSVRVNGIWEKSSLVLNYQTGEIIFKSTSESFYSEDTILDKCFSQKNNDVELHFNISLEMLKVLTSTNKEFGDECIGMLYLNNHFHNVNINYSFYNKSQSNENIDKCNIYFSFQSEFYPQDFQLDILNKSTKEPPMIWLNNQVINIINTE